VRIDLHCHTKATKKGDSQKRNVTPDKFKLKVEAANVSIVGITNHNEFDLDQYLELKKSVEGIADVWPGAELDINGFDNGHWHMLILGDPLTVDVFDRKMKQLFRNTTPNGFSCSFDDAWSLFKNDSVIFIPHCHDKRPCVSENEIDRIRNTTDDDWRVFYEPSTFTTVGIWSNHGRSMLIGSDVQDWDNYGGCNFAELRLPVTNFSQFCLLAQRDTAVIKTLLDEKNPNSIVVHPHSGVDVTIPIYEDINILFGQKGTGKSEIIKSLNNSLLGNGLSVVYYSGALNISQFNELMKTTTVIREPGVFARDSGSEAFSFIQEWKDVSPSPLKNYLAWGTTRNNNHKKERLRITECSSLMEKNSQNYLKVKGDYRTIVEFQRAVKDQGLLSYLEESKRNLFIDLIKQMAQNVKNMAVKEYIDYQSILYANRSLEAIKQSADKKSDTQSKPSSTNFLTFANKRIELRNNLTRIRTNLNPDERTSREFLGTLEEKGELYIISRYKYLDDSSLASEFVIGIRKLKDVIGRLNDAADQVFTTEQSSSLTELLASIKESGISDLSDFIGCSRYIELSGGNEKYEPSDGEKRVLLLEKQLREDADYYLIDEPELGMSNRYIDTVIRPILQNLSRRRKTVVIATHNANLAVRTLPYLSVYREHVSGDDYKTYAGNPFTDELVDLCDPENKKSWALCSMYTLEGGREAFYNRKTIYEAGIYED